MAITAQTKPIDGLDLQSERGEVLVRSFLKVINPGVAIDRRTWRFVCGIVSPLLRLHTRKMLTMDFTALMEEYLSSTPYLDHFLAIEEHAFCSALGH